MKTLKDLTIEDALTVLSIIRPNDDVKNFYITKNDKDYLVFRTSTYMIEEIWFYRNSLGTTFNIEYQKCDTDFDLIFLAYNKLIELGYTLKTVEAKINKLKQ